MGWGSLLGDFAKGVAKGYLEERGVQGALEDVGSIASGVKNFFSDSSSSASPELWNDMTERVCDLVKSEQFAEASELLDSYYVTYENSNADVYYYYWRSLILINCLESSVFNDENFKEIDEALTEAIREGRAFKDPEINKEFTDIKNRQNEARNYHDSLAKWDDMMSECDDLCAKGKGEEALQLLENYYLKEENGNYDFFYYRKKGEASAIIFYTSENPDEIVQKSYLTLKECYDKMKEMSDGSDSMRQSIEGCKDNLDFIYVESIKKRCNDFIDSNDFDQAEKLIRTSIKYESPHEYNNCMSRIKSLYIEYLVDSNETSESKISEALQNAEEALKAATASDDNDDTKKKRIQIVSERLEKAQNYLSALKRSGKASSNATKNPNADNEEEYRVEVKACLDDDGSISDRERRLLNKLRVSLGISEERANEIEETILNSSGLSPEEEEYLTEYKACIENDGVISDKERRLLDRLKKALNISDERAKQIEENAK